MPPPAGTNKWRTVVLTVALIIGATAGAYARGVDRSIPTGLWGGEHLGVEITSAGATLEFDCGHGAITVPLRVDKGGRFTAKGTYSPERGGPVRRGDAPLAAARYSGVLKGGTITLTVMLEAGKERIGTFTLTRGTDPLLTKCR